MRKNGRRLDGSHSVAYMRIILNESWTMIITGCYGAQASNDKCLNGDRLAEEGEAPRLRSDVDGRSGETEIVSNASQRTC